MMTTLEDAVRRVLMRHRGEPLCAREVAEMVTTDADLHDDYEASFGSCGPETSAVEDALRAMPDVEGDEESSDEDTYRLRAHGKSEEADERRAKAHAAGRFCGDPSCVDDGCIQAECAEMPMGGWWARSVAPKDGV